MILLCTAPYNGSHFMVHMLENTGADWAHCHIYHNHEVHIDEHWVWDEMLIATRNPWHSLYTAWQREGSIERQMRRIKRSIRWIDKYNADHVQIESFNGPVVGSIKHSRTDEPTYDRPSIEYLCECLGYPTEFDWGEYTQLRETGPTRDELSHTKAEGRRKLHRTRKDENATN